MHKKNVTTRMKNQRKRESAFGHLCKAGTMLGFVLFLFLVVESEQACSTKNNFPKMMMMMHDTCYSCFF
jgi:hypothetical protein